VQRYLGIKDSLTPGVEVVLCIFTCGLYSIYWNYKYGKLIADAQCKGGVAVEDNAILYLILAIFGLSIVSFIIMQNSLNKVWAQPTPAV
jgi:hypothetical protein